MPSLQAIEFNQYFFNPVVLRDYSQAENEHHLTFCDVLCHYAFVTIGVGQALD